MLVILFKQRAKSYIKLVHIIWYYYNFFSEMALDVIAGGLAGGSGILAGYPFDTVKGL